ncbi:MAG: radical SAM protein [Candidatus Sedimenticola sp. (ex Thyasira tokunagai)]
MEDTVIEKFDGLSPQITHRRIERILLLQPNLRWIEGNFKTRWEIHPINLCLIAAMIESSFDVSILDANLENLTEQQFGERIRELQPDLVGLTLLTSEYADVVHIATRCIKRINPEMITVLGGVYATQAPDMAGKDPNLDYLVLGEGELVFSELLAYIEGKAPLPVRGVAYWRNGQRIIQSKAPYIEDLNDLPLPAYHLIDYQRYTTTLQRISVDSPRDLPYGRMVTSRGCGVGCTFCEIESLSGKQFRARSVEHIIGELKYLKKEYGIKSIIFDDDNLYINRRRTRELCQAMIDEKLGLSWNAIAVPVFYINDEILELMRASGCQYIDMAIESGVERVLKEIINKPVDLDFAKRMVNKAKSLGIDVNAHFIIGLPGESWDEIRKTISYAESLDADYAKFFIYQPLPHTPLYERVIREGWLETGIDMTRNLNWSESRIVSEEFTQQDLRVLRAYEWERINFSKLEKREKIARMMRISEETLNQLRKETLASIAAVTYPAPQTTTGSEVLASAST